MQEATHEQPATAFAEVSAAGGLAVWLPLLLFAAVVVYGFRPVERWRLRHIPGPAPAWLIGNVISILKHGPHRLDLFYPQQRTPIFKIYVGARSIVVVENPELARHAALHSSIRPNFFGNSPMPNERAQSSLLWVSGAHWRSLRNSWQPMFFTGSLISYLPSMLKAAQFLADEMQDAAKHGRSINFHESLGDMTLATVAYAAFGVELHTQKADKAISANDARDKHLREAVDVMFGPVHTSVWDMLTAAFPFMLPLFRLLAPRMPDKPLRIVSAARETLDSLTADLFAEHHAALAAAGKFQTGPKVTTNGIHKVTANGTAAEKGELRKGVAPGSFLDLLVKGNDKSRGGAGFTDDVMAQQVLTVLLAGMDTTANTLTFACYLLAKPGNEAQQAALVAEVDAFGRDREPTHEDLEGFPYIDAVIKETTRMFPVGHTTFRVAEKDMNLGGYAIEKGQWMSIPIYSFQNNPKYWPDAHVFLPERWIEGHPDSSKQPTPSSAYMPFGEGPRVCVGMRFAMQEMKVALLRIFQRFNLELAPITVMEDPLKLEASITLGPVNGIHIHPRLRE